MIGNLKRLEILTLYNNKLTVLPDSIYECIELRVLNLSNNKLTQISPLIKQLIKLEVLNISRNLITTLPEEISSSKLLKDLDISLNAIISLPESLDNLAILQILNVSNNRLTQLPDTIIYMKSLEILDISNNIITSLPENIGELENLTIFNMQHNLLVDLPSSISKLVLLQILVLHNNKFTIVPISIRHLPRLTTNRFELLPNDYIGIYKDVKVGIQLKRLVKYTDSLLKSFVESVELENIFLLDFDMNTFRIYDNEKNENVLMTDFINENKLNYVIIYITTDMANIYHGIGFNREDEKKYIIECDRKQKILPYEKLIAEKIYDTDTKIKKNYMNALYESDSYIFFASDEYEIRNGTEFNKTVTNINLLDDLNFCRNFSDTYMYNIYMYFEEYLYMNDITKDKIKRYFGIDNDTTDENENALEPITFIGLLDSNERKLLKSYHEELPFHSLIPKQYIDDYQPRTEEIAAAIASINKYIIKYSGTFFPFLITCVYIFLICIYNIYTLYIIFKFINETESENIFLTFIYSLSHKYIYYLERLYSFIFNK